MKKEISKFFCTAPWTHTYVSPQGERRLCCASREDSLFQKQYIDKSDPSSKKFIPISLEDHWNSNYMKNIRKKMLNGEKLDQCEVCNNQILNIYTYRKYFTETLFPDKIKDIIENTDDTGFTSLKPISFDYRISNLCNFKCRMCGEQLSSSWETEKRKFHLWDKEKDVWMINSNRKRLEQFSIEVLENELWAAVKEKRIEEIYWVGGEPLMWKIHWEIMQYINKNFSLEEKKKITIRYNSNLSRTDFNSIKISDLLYNFKNINFCASIDAVGEVGEYIRTGLNYKEWLSNFQSLLFLNEEYNLDGIVLDVTLTLPGLLYLEEMFELAKKLKVKTYIKTTFAFDASVLMSPLCLPKELLVSECNRLLNYFTQSGVTPLTKIYVEAVEDLKSKKTFEYSFPNTYCQDKKRGKDFLKVLDEIRKTDIRKFLKKNSAILEWWDQE